MNDAMLATNRIAPSEKLLRERLENAGYVDVQSFTIRLPLGPWAKDKYEPSTDTVKTPHTDSVGLSKSWA
jgi:hypothetical protein